MYFLHVVLPDLKIPSNTPASIFPIRIGSGEALLSSPSPCSAGTSPGG